MLLCPGMVLTLSPLHCKGATSCFFSKHFQRRGCKSARQKELSFAQRRRDAEFKTGFYPASLCASASLRELVLVAAEGRPKQAGVQDATVGSWIPACAGMTAMRYAGDRGVVFSPIRDGKAFSDRRARESGHTQGMFWVKSSCPRGCIPVEPPDCRPKPCNEHGGASAVFCI